MYPDAATGVTQYCAPRLDEGFEVEMIRKRIALRAGSASQDETRPGALRGYVDRIAADLIEGWAQNIEHPEAPVCLDIVVGGRLIGQLLANRYREDLERAGLGSGRHAFRFRPPAEVSFALDAVEVRRSLDGAIVERSVAAQQELSVSAPSAPAQTKLPNIRVHRQAAASLC
jgi:hypothetical protein